MKYGHFEEHWHDDTGMPTGGVALGRGFTITWQNGPLGRGLERREPNGAFVEDVIQAVIGRLECYQASPFASTDNAEALAHLREAADWLDKRTQAREVRGVEGTHQP